MQVALFQGAFFPDWGLGLQAEHLGAHPGSLDRGRTLFGTKGKRTGNSTGAQAGQEKSSVNPGSAVKQEGVWHKKSSVNPGPCCEAGRCLVQEKAFYLVRKLRGSHPPVLCCRLMCVCLCVFLALSHLYNCQHCLLSRCSLVCHCLLPPIKPWSLISVSESFSEQADSCQGN